MSAYDELAIRCSEALWADDRYRGIDKCLKEVFCTLENVTPEMEAAGNAVNIMRGDVPRRMLLAMLRASPLAAPAEKEKGHD